MGGGGAAEGPWGKSKVTNGRGRRSSLKKDLNGVRKALLKNKIPVCGEDGTVQWQVSHSENTYVCTPLYHEEISEADAIKDLEGVLTRETATLENGYMCNAFWQVPHVLIQHIVETFGYECVCLDARERRDALLAADFKTMLQREVPVITILMRGHIAICLKSQSKSVWYVEGLGRAFNRDIVNRTLTDALSETVNAKDIRSTGELMQVPEGRGYCGTYAIWAVIRWLKGDTTGVYPTTYGNEAMEYLLALGGGFKLTLQCADCRWESDQEVLDAIRKWVFFGKTGAGPMADLYRMTYTTYRSSKEIKVTPLWLVGIPPCTKGDCHVQAAFVDAAV